MKKKIALAIIISITLLSAGCEKKVTVGNKQSDKNSVQTYTNNSSSTEISEYSKYSGTWKTEEDVKNNYKYGIKLEIEIDENGNLDGGFDNESDNASHGVDMDIQGKVKDNKFQYFYDEDGWGHSGTIELEFNKDTIKIVTKYKTTENSNSLWGVGQGTYTLVRSKK